MRSPGQAVDHLSAALGKGVQVLFPGLVGMDKLQPGKRKDKGQIQAARSRRLHAVQLAGIDVEHVTRLPRVLLPGNVQIQPAPAHPEQLHRVLPVDRHVDAPGLALHAVKLHGMQRRALLFDFPQLFFHGLVPPAR